MSPKATAISDYSCRPGSFFHTRNRVCRVIAALSVLMVVGFASAFWVDEAYGGEDGMPEFDLSEPLSLDKSIGLALQLSPYMQIQNLSIKIKQLDADNKWYQMFPKVDLSLSASVPVGGSTYKKNVYSVSMVSGGYDPIGAYYGHDAELKMVDMAKCAKLKTALEIIENVVTLYFYKEAYDAIHESQTKLEELAREGVAFASRMYPNAPTVPLDVRMVEHKLNQILLEKKKLVNTYTNQLIRLKRVLGAPVEQKIELEMDNIAEQVFLDFNPSEISYAQVKTGSVTEKMNSLRDELAGYGVYAAWADYVPKFSLAVQTPDPINNDASKDDSYYFRMYMTLPLLRWGELGRNLEKAQLKENQALLLSKAEGLTREDSWYKTRASVSELKSSLALAEAEVEMRTLAVRKSEILFNSGKKTYRDLLIERMSLERVKISLASAKQQYLVEKLRAYSMSGLLLDRYIKIENNEDAEK